MSVGREVSLSVGVVVMSDAAALRELTPDEAALVARHPLPEGVPDAEVNKFQLAHALDVSETTLDKWRRDGLPVESEGTNGRSYTFRLSVCYAWTVARREADQSARLRAEGAAQQLRLALIGGESAAGSRAALPPKEQRDLLDLEYAYMRAAAARGELMRAEDVAEAFQAVFAAIRDGLDALPDRAARELALSGPGVEALQRICDDVLDGARREVRAMIGDESEG